MKFAFAALALLLSSNAFALEGYECVQELKYHSDCVPRMLELQEMLSANSCDITGGHIATFITRDATRIFSVDARKCGVATVNFGNNRVESIAHFDGRLYIAMAQGNLLVIDRNNSVKEVLTTEGTPYKEVVQLAVVDGKLNIRQAAHRTWAFPAAYMDARVKKARNPIYGISITGDNASLNYWDNPPIREDVFGSDSAF